MDFEGFGMTIPSREFDEVEPWGSVRILFRDLPQALERRLHCDSGKNLVCEFVCFD